MTDQPEKKCFAISPIGDPTGTVRAEVDWVLKELIRPGLTPERAEEMAAAVDAAGLVRQQAGTVTLTGKRQERGATLRPPKG